MPSPWALIRNAEQPLETQTATPWAPIPDEAMQTSDTRARPIVSHLGSDGPGAPLTPVAMKHLGTDPGQENLNYAQAELEKNRERQARPWGFAGAEPSEEFPNGLAPNHPGKLGKVAHVFSEIGNIAGNVVAPDAMARIPQTQAGMKSDEMRLAKRVDTEENEKALRGEQGAQAAHLNAETPEIAPNAASLRGEQGAQQANLESETKMREHPLPEYSPLGYLTPEGQATEMEKHSGAITGTGPEGLRYAKALDKFQHVAGTLNGTPIQAAFDPLNHTFVNPDTGEQIFGFKPQPQVGMMGPVVVSPQGEVSRATPGKTLPEGFRTVSQGGSQNIPTSQMRNMGEMAATVLPMAENVKTEVQQLAGSIGPAAGRWNDLMVNKGGKDFPEFAGLDQDLDLLSSAIVRTHFGARGGQQYREELRKMLGAAQSPEDLVSRIDHADSWLRGYAQAGGAKVPESATPSSAPPPGARVRDYTNLGGPK